MSKDTSIQGEVQKIDYKAEESAFAVVRIQTDDGIVTATGPIGHLIPGMMASLTGAWIFSPAYGEQFEVKQALVESPQTLGGIRLYLQAQMQGVGKKTTARSWHISVCKR